MKIKIERLEMTNFKCFKHKEIRFDYDVTTIKGRNGEGKTTIADAIMWCLFGKNSNGQTDFDLKTHDENGKTIPNLDHSVEMTLVTSAPDDAKFEYTLRRTLKEVWVKRRGADEQVFKNNTTEYMINGEVVTAGDYKKRISELVSEDVFRAITNPNYFPSLKWQEQRTFLARLAGDVESEEIIGQDTDLQSLSNEVKEDIIAFRKHLSYQIKQIKDKLDKIPVRLEEQNKALPEKIDWESAQKETDTLKEQLIDIDEKIVATKSGNGQDVRKEAMRKELDELYEEKNEEEQKLMKKANEDVKVYDEKISELSRQFNSLLNDQKDLENSIKSFDTLITRCRETAEETFKSEQAYIREHWAETQESFQGETCPVCHQTLPADMMEEAERKFNLRKAQLKQQLTDRAAKAKQLLADAEKQAKEYETQKSEAEKKLEEVKQNINTTFANKQKCEREKLQLPSLDFLKENSLRLKELIVNIKDLQKEIEEVSTSDDDKKELEALEAQKAEIADKLSAISNSLATKSQYDRIQELIAGIEEEQKNLVSQLSELEQKEDVVRRYQERYNTILEERINQHFALVKWRMFKTVNNGGDPYDEPYCECYVDGSAYHDGLNKAAQLNAGLDICNTLCKHYDVSAPIIIDNSESSLNILETEGQQIRLEVSDCELSV